EIGFFERHPHTREPVAMEPPVVDPLFEVDPHGAERRQRAAPVVARVDVFCADLADGVVHGHAPRLKSGGCNPQRVSRVALYAMVGTVSGLFVRRTVAGAEISWPCQRWRVKSHGWIA